MANTDKSRLQMTVVDNVHSIFYVCVAIHSKSTFLLFLKKACLLPSSSYAYENIFTYQKKLTTRLAFTISESNDRNYIIDGTRKLKLWIAL